MEDKRKELEEILAKKYGRINDETITEILYLFGVVASVVIDEEKVIKTNPLMIKKWFI